MSLSSVLIVVNHQRILNEFIESQRAKAILQEKKAKWDKEIEMLDDSLKASIERFKSNLGKSSKKKIQEMQKEFYKKSNDLDRYKKEKAKEAEKTRGNDVQCASL